MAPKRKASNQLTAAQKKKMMLVPADVVVPGYTRNKGIYGRFDRSLSTFKPELKWYDIETLYAITPATGFRSTIMQTFNPVPQGTGPSERIGQKIRIKSFGIRFSMWMPAGTLLSNDVQSHLARLILFVDCQNNGLGFTTPDFLHGPVTPADPNAQCFRNLTNTGRFKVIHDQKFNLNYTGTSANGATSGVTNCAQTLLSGELYKDMDLTVEFGGPTGVLSEIKSNNIGGILVLNDLPIAGTGGVSLFLNSRVRYED